MQVTLELVECSLTERVTRKSWYPTSARPCLKKKEIIVTSRELLTTEKNFATLQYLLGIQFSWECPCCIEITTTIEESRTSGSMEG